MERVDAVQPGGDHPGVLSGPAPTSPADRGEASRSGSWVGTHPGPDSGNRASGTQFAMDEATGSWRPRRTTRGWLSPARRTPRSARRPWWDGTMLRCPGGPRKGAPCISAGPVALHGYLEQIGDRPGHTLGADPAARYLSDGRTLGDPGADAAGVERGEIAAASADRGARGITHGVQPSGRAPCRPGPGRPFDRCTAAN